MIRASGLTRRFGPREAVRDVGFTVAAGEVVGFLGPNGAGKTTTMRLLLGLLRPTAGTAALDGATGYLPEQFTGYDPLSVRSFLGYVARMKGLGPAAGELHRVMDEAAVGDLARRPLGRLSKGQRQRVGLAQALLGRPANLVLDEPTIGLDPRQALDTRRLVRAAAGGGAAVLLSTHLLAEAAAVCDRVVVIAAGRVVAEERPGPDLEARFLRLVEDAERDTGEPAT